MKKKYLWRLLTTMLAAFMMTGFGACGGGGDDKDGNEEGIKKVWIECTTCKGSGKCELCKGNGVCFWCKGAGVQGQFNETCLICNGNGKCSTCYGSGKCQTCNGSGGHEEIVSNHQQNDTSSGSSNGVKTITSDQISISISDITPVHYTYPSFNGYSLKVTISVSGVSSSEIADIGFYIDNRSKEYHTSNGSSYSLELSKGLYTLVAFVTLYEEGIEHKKSVSLDLRDI